MDPVKREWWADARAEIGQNRWWHVFAPPHGGKSAFFDDLQVRLDKQAGARVLRVRAEGPAAPAIQTAVDPSREPGTDFDLWPALSESAESDESLLYVIIDGIDHWLLSDSDWEQLVLGFRGAWAGLSDRLHVVTAATFSVEALAAKTSKTGARMPIGFEERAAPGFPYPGDEDAEKEMPRLQERLDAYRYGDHRPRIVEAVVKKCDGHPGLVLDLLNAIDACDKPPTKRGFVEAVVERGESRLRDYPETLVETLFPWSDSAISTARHAEVICEALQYLLIGQADNDMPGNCAVSFCRSLGLVTHEAVEFGNSAAESLPRGWEFKVPYMGWLPLGDEERLQARMTAIQGETLYDLRQAENRRRQEDDPHIALVRALAEEYFCNTERGQSQQTAIEGDCRPIIDGRYYSLTLASHQEHVVAEAAARDEPTVQGEKVIRNSLRIFLGVPEQIRDLWQRDFAVLRQISDTSNDALPDIRESGTLEDIVAADEPFGFILLKNEGHEITVPVRDYFRQPENRSRVVHEVRRLVQALVDLQKQGIVHRLINRRTLRWEEVGGYKQLRLGGFELVTSAYTHSAVGDEALLKKISARRLADLVGVKRNRIFCEPAAQYLFCDDSGAAEAEEKTSFMPQSDVFALCMTLCDLFLGPPREDDVRAFEAAADGYDAAEAQKVLLDNYKADVVARPSEIVSPTLRDILLSGLEQDTANRPTAIELMAEIVRRGSTLYVEYAPQANTTFILTYDAENTLTELDRNLQHLLGFTAQDKEAPTKLQSFLEAQLRSATHVFRDPSGFGRFVADTSRKTLKHDKATVVIACEQGLNFYCDLAGPEYGLPSSNGRVLVLRYTLDRRNHAISGLVDKRASIVFPDTAFKLVPSNNAAIVDNQLENLARDGTRCGNWQQLLHPLLDPDVPIPLQAAYDALQFITEIEFQERRLMSFPVRVKKSEDTGHFCRIELDTERFHSDSVRDPYQHLLFQDARMLPETFFQVKLLEWLEKAGNFSDERISFRKRGTDTNVSLPIRPNDVRRGFILVHRRLRNLEGEGRLAYSDDQGVLSLYSARKAALAQLRFNCDILDQLETPSPTMALSRKRPDGFGEGLRGRAREIVWSMIDAHPMFLLQGPPGTGKTRALSEAVYHVLTNEEKGAKFLVSAQSHASVDTTLQRIAQTFREKRSETVGERFHMIRYMPAVDKDRVDASIRDRFALESVVGSVARRMRETAEEELDRLDQATASEPHWQSMRRAALRLLREASDEAYDEIERRVQRNASLHFATTSSVRADTIGMFGMDSKFHTAVVEEAAKVWGAGIIQPLIMARKAVLVGDHKQIGPFDSRRFNRLAVMACGGDPNDGMPGYVSADADPIYPQYRDEPYAMVNWLETFRRIFERYESGALDQVQHGVRMADTLDTQFRSTREIGELVSHAFYDDRVVYGEVEHDLDRQLIDTEALGVGERSLIWLNTERLNSSHLHASRNDGRIENEGEARILQRLLAKFRRRAHIEEAEESDVPINERLLILSPYRSQIQKITQILSDDPTRYGFSQDRDEALAQIASCCTSIDAAQGMEADTVIVSCVRSVSPDDRDYPSRESHADAAEWNLVMRRNFGFMTEPERINVMLSRARLQLFCIGNFDHFDSISDVVEDWAHAHGQGSPQALDIERQQGFWARLTGYFKDQEGTIVDLTHGGGNGLV